MKNDSLGKKTNAVMIHGRFQPFTIGHMQLVKKAIELTTPGTKILIGITKPDLKTDNQISKGDNHRDSVASNPYSYMIRKEMIVCSLLLDEDARARIDDFIIFPFPLSRNNIEQSKDAILKVVSEQEIDGKILQLVNTIQGDGWEEEKVSLFREMGFKTKNISENGVRIRTKDGTEVSASRYRETKDTRLLAPGTNKVKEILDSKMCDFAKKREGLIEGFDQISIENQKKILIALRQELLNDEEIQNAIKKINDLNYKKVKTELEECKI